MILATTETINGKDFETLGLVNTLWEELKIN